MTCLLQEVPGASEALAAARELLPVWVPWLGPVVWAAVAALGGALTTWFALRGSVRRLERAAEDPWTERARFAWPFQRGGVIAQGAALALGFTAGWWWVAPIPGLPPRVVMASGGLAAFGGALCALWRLCQRLRPIGARPFLRRVAIEWLVLRTTALTFFPMLMFMPRVWGTGAVAVGALALTLHVVLMRGGMLALLRGVGWLQDADPELQELGRQVAQAVGGEEPRVGVLEAGFSNAFMVPLANEVILTREARDCLSDGQLRSVLAHEAGHGLEPRSTQWLRVAVSALPLTYAFVGPLSHAIGSIPAVFVLLLPLVVALRLFLGLSRRLERSADRIAVEHGGTPEVYVAALEAMCRANLIPVVLGRRRGTHPDLAERFEQAGVELPWPRPEPPRRGGLLRVAALLALAWSALLVPLHVGRERLHQAAWQRASISPALLACSGRHPWLLELHGYGRASQGDAMGALAMARAARALAPEDLRLQLDGARLAARLGALEEARALLGEAAQRVEARSPTDAWEVAELSRIRDLLGEREAAAALRARALELAAEAGVLEGVQARLEHDGAQNAP